MIDRVPPNNVDLEMAILGAIMLDPQGSYKVASTYLDADSWYLDGHRMLFELMGELVSRGIQPDYEALVDEVKSRGQLEVVGGVSVLAGMLAGAPSGSIEPAVKKVAEKGRLRSMIRACAEISDECYRQELAWDDLSSRALSSVSQVATSSNTGSLLPIGGSLREYWAALTDLEEQHARLGDRADIGIGFKTGFYDIDRRRRLRAGEVTIIAAAPSVGKTAMALTMINHMAVQDRQPCLMFSLEMSHESLVSRLLAIGSMYQAGEGASRRVGGVSTDQMERMWELSDTDKTALLTSRNNLAKAPLVIEERHNVTSATIRSGVAQFVAKNGPGPVFIDYLGLVNPTADQRSGNKSVEVGNISRAIKNISIEMKVPIVLLCQLSRDSAKEKRMPRLSDLRDSGAIEQDADVVHFLYRKPEQEELPIQEIRVITDKNRHGPTGANNLHFYRRMARFVNPTRS